MNDAFLAALTERGPHPSLGAHADTYGRLIGSWKGELVNHRVDPPAPAQSIEVHFGWVLDGRAVQDVWITPARDDPNAPGRPSLSWYGCTLRVFDPKCESWHVTWTDPRSGVRLELAGTRQGDDVVQLGTRGGRPMRWTFSQFQPNSVLWQGHLLETDGVTWQLEVEIRLRR